MSGTNDDEQSVARLPRAESVVPECSAVEALGNGYRAFGVAADSFERHLAMLELRLRTGDRMLFAYHTLGRAEWNPSRGITLLFLDMSVVVKGRNLDGLFAAIREQKAAWVWEADRSAGELALPTAAVVDAIVVESLRGAK